MGEEHSSVGDSGDLSDASLLEVACSCGNVLEVDATSALETQDHELGSEREFIEASLDAIPDIFYTVDPEGNFQRWNEKLPDLTGYTDAEIDSMNALEFFEGEHRESIESAIDTILRTGTDVTEAEITTKDGRQIPHEFRGVKLTDDAGSPTGIVGIARDITARKQREQELTTLNTRFELALEHTDTGIWELDLDSNTVRWDATSERLFGYDPGEYPGTYAGVGSRVDDSDSESAPAESGDSTDTDEQYRPEYGDRIPAEDVARVSEQLDHAIATGEQYQADFRIQPPDGTQRWMRARGVVEYDDSGEPDRVIGIQTDITDQKERERELEETKATLQRKNERLNKFTSMISHDLRNPLEIAEGYLEKARETDDEADLDTVEAALDRMGAMIDDLLTLARAETVVSDPEPVVLADIVTTAWETTRTEEATMECTLPDSMTVAADRSLLRHVFENFFRNAVEHNDAAVTVSVGQLDSGGFFIEDTGAGIPEAEQDVIFEHGYTTEDSGTGFGLTIIRELIEAHGWTISVSDGDGGGARFEILTDDA